MGYFHASVLLTVILFVSCSQNDKKTYKGEYIYRLQHESFYSPPLPQPQERDPYPWEEKTVGGFPRITKDFFRCKGNWLNPPNAQMRDCQGDSHGLPLKDGKEFIFPCLLEVLNYIQEKTQKRVIITTGHRCPLHNAYCEPKNGSSKHLIGAEVDFYVEGMEKEPSTIIGLIQQYYRETPSFADHKEYTTFQRYEKEGLNVVTTPWFNKEIFIKLYLEKEGRDADNQHPYPYLCLQVRYDRESNKPVQFDHKQAQNYLRY